MKTKFYAVLAALALLLMQSCSNDKNAVLEISRPLPNIDLGKNTFLIDTSKDTLLEIASGSTILVPANSLVTADNKEFTGKAELTYEEFSNQASIILSGIPMKYDSAGEEGHLQSAGMFQINATSTSGEQLAIAQGKNVTVSMASSIEDGEKPYNFYQFDTISGEWKYIVTKSAEPAAPKPADTVAIDGDAKVIKYKTVKTVSDFVFDINVNYQVFPELAGLGDVMWKFSGNKKYADPEKEQWIFDKSWPVTKIDKDKSNPGQYIIVLRSASDTFTTSVVPVSNEIVSGNEVIAQVSKSVENIKVIETEIGRQLAENTLRRTMELSSFGFYNWDFIHRLINRKIKKIRLMADGSELPSQYRVYQVFVEENAVLEFYRNRKEPTIPVSSEQDFVMIAIGENGEAMIARDGIALYDNGNNGVSDVVMINTGTTIASEDDLMSVIYGF